MVGGQNRKTKEQFVAEAELIVPPGRYDFSGMVYVTSIAKSRVKCNLHGYFVTTPDRILRGSGCPKCGVIKRAKTIATKGMCEVLTSADRAAASRMPLYNIVMTALLSICAGGEHVSR